MFKPLFFFLFLSSFCFAQSIPVPSVEFSPKQYVCYKSGETINADGNLAEAAWTKAEWTDDFIDIEGLSKALPRFRTRAKMLWDDNYFYIAAEISEPHIWGSLKNRDDIIFYDNDFEVFIDPDGDTHRYAEYEMNALNTVWDLFLVQPYRDTKNAAVNNWDMKNLKSGVTIQGTLNNAEDSDDSWTVEIAFPWKAFKEISDNPAPPVNNDQWRVNFSRVEWKTEVKNNQYQKQINPQTGKSFPEDNWVWSPQGVVNMHYPEMWGFVQFSEVKVGTLKTDFIDNPDESAKWYLRNIYYKQHQYFEKNSMFTENPDELNLPAGNIPGFILPPVIHCTPNMFEASLHSDNGKKILSIRNDGLTWISEDTGQERSVK